MSSPVFTLFGSLPAEIRLQIWRESCHARVVEVNYDGDKDRCHTPTEAPAILHVCQESRYETTRMYKKLFGTRTQAAHIYFHPDLDTLYIPRPKLMGYDTASRDFTKLVTGASHVRNLALDHVNPAVRRPWETYNKYILMQSFTRVAEVYMVLNSNPAPPPEGIQHGFVKLAEPIGDPTSISRLLADLKESFTYEAGATFEDAKSGFQTEHHQPTAPPLVLKSKINADYLRLL